MRTLASLILAMVLAGCTKNIYRPGDTTGTGGASVYIADSNNNRVRKIDGGSQTIATIAGTGAAGFSGDGGAAITAQFSGPRGLLADRAGGFYVVDASNHCVRRVNANGIVTTVAGSGVSGFSGDGGPAIAAKLALPQDVALDSAGNLYISEFTNQRIRRVDGTGTITTYAGNGTGAFAGDGSAAASASLYGPAGIVIDASGNLYIADQGNERVRKVSPGGTITTIAGNGTAGYGGDGGPATSAQFNWPTGLALDSSGNLYISDYNNHCVRRLSTSDGKIGTYAGSCGVAGAFGDGGPATAAQMYLPLGLVFDSAGNLFVSESGNNRIRKIATDGTISTVAGSTDQSAGYGGDGGPAINATLNLPWGLMVMP